MALARHKDAAIPPLLKMLDAPRLDSRYGACEALIVLRGRGAPAVAALRKLLVETDLLKGLDPAPGFLHVTENGRWSVALDLMEPFRPVLTEALALDLPEKFQPFLVN